MKTHDQRPTSATFNILINGALRRREQERERGGEKEGEKGVENREVEFWMEEMRKEGVRPDEVTYNMLIFEAAKKGEQAEVKVCSLLIYDSKIKIN